MKVGKGRVARAFIEVQEELAVLSL